MGRKPDAIAVAAPLRGRNRLRALARLLARQAARDAYLAHQTCHAVDNPADADSTDREITEGE